MELDWTLIVAGILAALLVLGKGGNFLDAIKAFFAAFVNSKPVEPAEPVQTIAGPVLPSIEERRKAVQTLKRLFDGANCKDGQGALNTVIDHLLDDLKTHEK